MGRRKKDSAEARKEANKTLYVAKLMNNPTSPRKTRLVADMVRGVDVDKALGILKYCPRESAPKIHKLVLSAVANWQAKNEGKRLEDGSRVAPEVKVGERVLFGKYAGTEIKVDGEDHMILKESDILGILE